MAEQVDGEGHVHRTTAEDSFRLRVPAGGGIQFGLFVSSLSGLQVLCTGRNPEPEPPRPQGCTVAGKKNSL